MNEEEIYRKAWAKWHDLQFIMLFEEMAELQKAVTKYLRMMPYNFGEEFSDNIIEELADVEIMIEQMKVKFGSDKVLLAKEKKLKRLKQMLEE